MQEILRVQGQNSRARSMKTKATLTLSEWEQTIADFGGMCAYCNIRSFTLLEHFIPFGYPGDGTHVNNCLPACQQCNKIKRDLGLEVFKQRFSTETIERLQTYLAGRTHQPDIPKPRAMRIPKPSPPSKPKREKLVPVAIPSNVSHLTLEQAAAGLGMAQDTIHKYTKMFSIQTRRFGRDRHKYISRKDFEYLRAIKETPWKFPELEKPVEFEKERERERTGA